LAALIPTPPLLRIETGYSFVRENPKLKRTSGKKFWLTCQDFAFSTSYICRGAIDETLPKRTNTSTLVDQKARLKDVARKRCETGVGSSLLIVWSGGCVVLSAAVQ
jgi:hypothetical protein